MSAEAKQQSFMRARFWGPTLRPAPTAQGYDWTDVLEGDPPRTIPPAAYAAFANGETRRSELSGSSYPGRVLSSTTFSDRIGQTFLRATRPEQSRPQLTRRLPTAKPDAASCPAVHTQAGF